MDVQTKKCAILFSFRNHCPMCPKYMLTYLILGFCKKWL